jgi:hypothetical protein
MKITDLHTFSSLLKETLRFVKWMENLGSDVHMMIPREHANPVLVLVLLQEEGEIDPDLIHIVDLIRVIADRVHVPHGV